MIKIHKKAATMDGVGKILPKSTTKSRTLDADAGQARDDEIEHEHAHTQNVTRGDGGGQKVCGGRE